MREILRERERERVRVRVSCICLHSTFEEELKTSSWQKTRNETKSCRSRRSETHLTVFGGRRWKSRSIPKPENTFFGVDFVFRAAMFPALYLVLIALAVILVISVIKSSVRPSNFPPGELKNFFFWKRPPKNWTLVRSYKNTGLLPVCHKTIKHSSVLADESQNLLIW